jgi:hypothetical protein
VVLGCLFGTVVAYVSELRLGRIYAGFYVFALSSVVLCGAIGAFSSWRLLTAQRPSRFWLVLLCGLCTVVLVAWGDNLAFRSRNIRRLSRIGLPAEVLSLEVPTTVKVRMYRGPLGYEMRASLFRREVRVELRSVPQEVLGECLSLGERELENAMQFGDQEYATELSGLVQWLRNARGKAADRDDMAPSNGRRAQHEASGESRPW